MRIAAAASRRRLTRADAAFDRSRFIATEAEAHHPYGGTHAGTLIEAEVELFRASLRERVYHRVTAGECADHERVIETRRTAPPTKESRLRCRSLPSNGGARAQQWRAQLQDMTEEQVIALERQSELSPARVVNGSCRLTDDPAGTLTCPTPARSAWRAARFEPKAVAEIAESDCEDFAGKMKADEYSPYTNKPSLTGLAQNPSPCSPPQRSWRSAG